MALERQHKLEEALDKLVTEPGLVGALLVSRDGFPIVNRFARVLAAETFSAMSATFVGAAEAALAEAGMAGTARFVIEVGEERLVALGATGELLLVVIAKTSSPLDTVVAKANATVSQIKQVVGG